MSFFFSRLRKRLETRFSSDRVFCVPCYEKGVLQSFLEFWCLSPECNSYPGRIGRRSKVRNQFRPCKSHLGIRWPPDVLGLESTSGVVVYLGSLMVKDFISFPFSLSVTQTRFKNHIRWKRPYSLHIGSEVIEILIAVMTLVLHYGLKEIIKLMK